MNNVYTMVPKKPAQYNILTKQERLVYVPLATRETAGIVKIGDGLSVSGDGVLTLAPYVLYDLENKVDKLFDLELSGGVFRGSINNNNRGIILQTEDGVYGALGVGFTNTKRFNLNDSEWSSVHNFKTNDNGSEADDFIIGEHKASIILTDGPNPVAKYIKIIDDVDDQYNGEVSTIPYVNYKVSDKATYAYVNDAISNVKRAGSYVFDTFEHFEAWIQNAYVRDDGVVVDSLQLGDNIFVVEKGIPDYWVKSVKKPFTLDNFEAYETGDPLPTVLRLEE